MKSFYIEPLVNRSINVCAQFENSGEIAVTARFKGEVYCDGAFVDVIESEEKPVALGETLSPLWLHVRIPGEYLIRGSVLYDGRETETKEVSFNVPE